MRCFFDRESVSAEILLPGNSGNQAKTMTSFTLFTYHYPTECVCVFACAQVQENVQHRRMTYVQLQDNVRQRSMTCVRVCVQVQESGQHGSMMCV